MSGGGAFPPEASSFLHLATLAAEVSGFLRSGHVSEWSEAWWASTSVPTLTKVAGAE